MNDIKITGVKKAVGDYKRLNKGGYYSPHYGNLMIDRDTGEVWTDEYYDISHKSYTVYKYPSIADLIELTGNENFIVNMKNVKEAAKKACEEWKENNK